MHITESFRLKAILHTNDPLNGKLYAQKLLVCINGVVSHKMANLKYTVSQP